MRGCPRKIRRLWNSSCERMGVDVVLYNKDYSVALKLSLTLEVRTSWWNQSHGDCFFELCCVVRM